MYSRVLEYLELEEPSFFTGNRIEWFFAGPSGVGTFQWMCLECAWYVYPCLYSVGPYLVPYTPYMYSSTRYLEFHYNRRTCGVYHFCRAIWRRVMSTAPQNATNTSRISPETRVILSARVVSGDEGGGSFDFTLFRSWSHAEKFINLFRWLHTKQSSWHQKELKKKIEDDTH